MIWWSKIRDRCKLSGRINHKNLPLWLSINGTTYSLNAIQRKVYKKFLSKMRRNVNEYVIILISLLRSPHKRSTFYFRFIHTNNWFIHIASSHESHQWNVNRSNNNEVSVTHSFIFVKVSVGVESTVYSRFVQRLTGCSCVC